MSLCLPDYKPIGHIMLHKVQRKAFLQSFNRQPETQLLAVILESIFKQHPFKIFAIAELAHVAHQDNPESGPLYADCRMREAIAILRRNGMRIVNYRGRGYSYIGSWPRRAMSHECLGGAEQAVGRHLEPVVVTGG